MSAYRENDPHEEIRVLRRRVRALERVRRLHSPIRGIANWWRNVDASLLALRVCVAGLLLAVFVWMPYVGNKRHEYQHQCRISCANNGLVMDANAAYSGECLCEPPTEHNPVPKIVEIE